jgi:hypothetical integral membrane protein (TIGR02206 family)
VQPNEKQFLKAGRRTVPARADRIIVFRRPLLGGLSKSGARIMIQTGEPFQSFGFIHILTAVAVIGFAAGLPVLIARRANKAQLERIRVILAGIVAMQIVLNVWIRVALYGQPLQTSLPLDLCNASLVLGIVILLFRNYRAYEIAYFWALAGGIPAILMPDLRYTIPHPFYWLFFAGHGLELACVALATFAFGFRPTLASVGRALIVTALYAAVILPLNYVLGSNYLYLRHKPMQPSVMDLMGPWPWYIVGLAVLAVVLSLLSYLPFARHGRSWDRS